MREITLKISENNFPFFMELVHKLGIEVAAKDNDWYEQLHEEDKKNIQISLQQADKEYNTIPQHEVRKKIKDKINKLRNN